MQAASTPSAASTSSAHDFDFLVGFWEVSNRRLKVRNVGSTDWDEFPGRQVMRTVLGGIGNVDEIEFPSKGWSGLTLRFFNPETRQWSIYWVNSRAGIMQAPVVGAFNNGVGEFFGEDVEDGKAVRVRYTWSHVTGNAARWEQAFSLDGGKTWEINWIMNIRRKSELNGSGPNAIDTPPESAQETVAPHHQQRCCPVVELRQYTLHPGKRETLIELFDREFVESQEQLGMRVIGQFRDMDNPDRFVWLRGFGDFNVRANQLQAFYGGPVWAAHRAVANATMVDASNVLLLRPARANGGFQFQGRGRPPSGPAKPSDAIVVATIYNLDAPVRQGFTEFFERTVMPEMSRAGAPVAAYFVSSVQEFGGLSKTSRAT